MQWVKIYSDYIYFTQPPWDTGSYYFCHLTGEEAKGACPRWPCEWVGRAGLTPRPSGSSPVCLHPRANHALWKWRAMVSGMKVGVQGWGDIGGIRPAATVALTCWQPRRWQLPAEQACSLSPQMLLQLSSCDRRFCSLGYLVLQPRIPERRKSPKSHKYNLLVYFLTHVLPLYLVREIQ